MSDLASNKTQQRICHKMKIIYKVMDFISNRHPSCHMSSRFIRMIISQAQTFWLLFSIRNGRSGRVQLDTKCDHECPIQLLGRPLGLWTNYYQVLWLCCVKYFDGFISSQSRDTRGRSGEEWEVFISGTGPQWKLCSYWRRFLKQPLSTVRVRSSPAGQLDTLEPN